MYIECGVGLRKTDMELKQHYLMARRTENFITVNCLPRKLGLGKETRFCAGTHW